MTQGKHNRKSIVILGVFLLVSVALNVWLLIENHKTDSDMATTQSVNYTVLYDTVKDAKPLSQGEKQVGVLAVAKSKLAKHGKCGNFSPKHVNTSDTVSNHAEKSPSKTIGDEDSVYLPITQKTYHKDSLYTVWVSGYCPNLDSIHVFNRTTIKTVTITKTKKEKRFGLGLQVGYGFGKSGATPYIGVGVQYRLFGF